MASGSLTNEAGEAKAPEEIVYIPEGVHRITPLVDGKARAVTVRMLLEQGEEVASAFQQALVARHASNVRPTLDFDHKANGPAAGIPRAFRYEAGRGLMLAVDWTEAGRKAIEGRDYSYFSPDFLLGEDGVPAGIAERWPVGALVNEPAFREIPRIAASDAAAINNAANEMSILVQCGLLSEEESALQNPEDLASARVKALRADQNKIAKLEQQIAKLERELEKEKEKASKAEESASSAKKEKAESLIACAVVDGRLAPKDEESKAFWREQLMGGGERSVKAFHALPKAFALDMPLVRASAQELPCEEGVKGISRVAAAIAAEQAV